jgi:lipoyl(octanoyl) transferase
VRIIRGGVQGYEQAWQLQRELHAARVDGAIEDTVVLLQHPSTYTAGKRTRPAERPSDGTPVVDVDRGGKITWHGPGQLVGYPILQLAEPIDVVAYVRALELVLMDVCAEFGLTTIRVEGRTGVWVAGDTDPASGAVRVERKVAAIGVRVARRVTLHGFALNCDADLRAYDTIIPCGIADAGVTSLSAELGRPVPVAEVLPVLERHLVALTELVALASSTRGRSPKVGSPL